MDTQQRKTRDMHIESKSPSSYHFAFNKYTVIKNRYRIVKKIGEGGFGTVFEAFDLILNKSMALKFFYPEIIIDKMNLIRIKREINISQKISDESIVKLFSLEKWRDTYFLVMELIHGQTLKEYLSDRARVKWKDFKDIFFQILKGINTLHKKNIIHRDIKPSNIMLISNNQIKILDFGLSKELSDTEKTSVTGAIMGSPQYMSPEQIQAGDLDFRSDIYQLGLLLYYSLSGVHPFESSTSTIDMMIKQLNEEPEKFSTHGVKVPDYVEFAIQKSLKKKKKQRFQSIDEIITLFKKGKVSFWAKLKSRVLYSPLRFAIPVFLIILSLFSAYFITSGSKVFDSFKIEGTKILAKNKFGFKIWEKDFTPYKISSTNVLQTGNFSHANYYIDSKDKKIILSFLQNPKSLLSSKDESIISNRYNNRVALLNMGGEILEEVDLHKFFSIDSYDFTNSFNVADLSLHDVNKDGEPEMLIKLRHKRTMFPSAFGFIYGIRVFSFSNPGMIMKVNLLEANDHSAKFLIYGSNNIVCHLDFVAEVKFDIEDINHAYLYSIPNLQANKNSFNGVLHFLPKNYKEDINKWKSSGILTVTDYFSGDKVTLYKNNCLVVKTNSGEKVYQDQLESLQQVYHLINRYYQEKNLYQNKEKAHYYISKAIKFHIKNPYLCSALYYFLGDVEIDRGLLKKGKQSLLTAIHHYPYNLDASQRLCEIEFLNGKPLIAAQMAETEYGHFQHFWGVNFGREMFRMYCYLHVGDFVTVSQIFALATKKSTIPSSEIFDGLTYIFKGDYLKAYNLIQKANSCPAAFTIAEYRLLLGRAMLLAKEEMNIAKFFFSDISLHSLSLMHLAKISYAYFLAKDGERQKALQIVKPAFNKLLQLSTSNFETRLWLFYDAYIYAKTMEILENKTEVIRGYKTCIKANPYTDLAKKSKRELDKIKTDY